MSIQLTIRDGTPWWASLDIWVVPGTDPYGPTGAPVVGQGAYVWARASNAGKTAATNARLNYYWGNPATVLTVETVTRIGTSYVTLASGEARDVLCLAPWIPVWVNDGHECLVVEVFHPDDAISRGPGQPLAARDDRHVAQKNVGVLQA